jgi:hypothetical protein
MKEEILRKSKRRYFENLDNIVDNRGLDPALQKAIRKKLALNSFLLRNYPVPKFRLISVIRQPGMI